METKCIMQEHTYIPVYRRCGKGKEKPKLTKLIALTIIGIVHDCCIVNAATL